MTEYIIELDGYEAYKAGENLDAIDESEEFYGEIVDELVRCRDCKHCMRGDFCNLNNEWDKRSWQAVEPNGFCAWAERRDAE